MIRAVPIGFKERLVDPFYLSQNLGASGPSETAGRATTLAHVSRSRSLPVSFIHFGRLRRRSWNSFGPLISRRLRTCRSSSDADGSPKRSIS
jgi:hypothetical protein